MTSVYATVVARVIGWKTVAFVVGGSSVLVTVYAEVTLMTEVRVSVITTVDPALTVV